MGITAINCSNRKGTYYEEKPQKPLCSHADSIDFIISQHDGLGKQRHIIPENPRWGILVT
jgi:hypothetical protein